MQSFSKVSANIKSNHIFLIGKKRRETVCIALTTEEPDAKDGELLMNKVVRRNLRVRMGDTVSVNPRPNDVLNSKLTLTLFCCPTCQGV